MLLAIRKTILCYNKDINTVFLKVKKDLLENFQGVFLLTLHNEVYAQISDIKGFEAYFLAVCEKRAVYNKTGSEKPVKSRFLFLKIFKIPEISQSPCVPSLAMNDSLCERFFTK